MNGLGKLYLVGKCAGNDWGGCWEKALDWAAGTRCEIKM
jgi:hypothetical protein